MRIYVCGVTVYDLCHIGHARSAIVVRRDPRATSGYRGYAVTYVRNFTDIDDKIIRRANEEGVPAAARSPSATSRRTATTWPSLGVLPADVEPQGHRAHPADDRADRAADRTRATPIRSDGDVYFEVRRFPAYGKLSGKNLDELQAGARVEVDERKRDPLDFALWKARQAGRAVVGEPVGPGPPRLAHRVLGDGDAATWARRFDIHGGGEDLIFPHHENEIAQTEAATGKPFARYWMHNGFVNLRRREDVEVARQHAHHPGPGAARHDPEALRLYLLGTHYRHPLEFADERVGEAGRGLARLRSLKEEAERIAARGTPAPGPDGGALRPGGGAAGPVRDRHGRRLQHRHRRWVSCSTWRACSTPPGSRWRRAPWGPARS